MSHRSYRHQVVRLNDFTSHSKQETSGVIQGSVLDPLLFLVHVRDIFNVIRNGVTFLFADGIKIVYAFHSEAPGSTLAERNTNANVSQRLG